MAALKTDKMIICSSIEYARIKADKFSNGIIVEKDNIYLVVNYRTYEDLKVSGYKQVR